MNLETQRRLFDEAVTEMRRILFTKGNDYADEDRLSNFKRAGEIAGLTAELNCLSLIATKVARLGALLNSNQTAENEPIEDSLLDLANYALLLRMIRQEKSDEKTHSSIGAYVGLHRGYIRTGPSKLK